jgi:hypothetical protein
MESIEGFMFTRIELLAELTSDLKLFSPQHPSVQAS